MSCPATAMLASAWREQNFPLEYAARQYGPDPIPVSCMSSHDRGHEAAQAVGLVSDADAGVDVANEGSLTDTNPFFTILTEVPNGPGLANAATMALPAAAETGSSMYHLAALLSAGARPN